MNPQEVSYAIVSDMYWVPLSEIDAHRVRDHFTVKAQVLNYHTKKMETNPIPIYREDTHDRPGLIGLPIAEGERLFPTDDLIEDLSDGGVFDQWTRLPDPNHPQAAPGQDEFMQLTWDAIQDSYTSLIKAETGTGKTVVALGTAAELGRSTLVSVPTVQLMKQWIRECQDILGLDRKDIGIVQGEKCQYNKPICIAVQKSLVMRRYAPEFYSAFGTVITDELHNTGATTISRVQGQFKARYKFGLTATDHRRDGANKVYYDYYGKPAFERSMQGVPTTLYVVPYHGEPINSTNSTDRVKYLSRDHDRNEWLTSIAAHWYQNGEDVLMVTKLVEHCDLLSEYMQAQGVPEKHIGIFTAGEPVKKRSKKRLPVNQEYLDWCLNHAPVLIATDKMFKEGMDAPRLSAGMDCAPYSELEQMIGRVRRRFDGKDRALWVTPVDFATPKLRGLQYPRVKSVSHLKGIKVVKTTRDALIRR